MKRMVHMHSLTAGLVRSSLALLATAALAACSSLPTTPAAGPGKRLAEAAPATTPAPQDAAITQNVRSQLAREMPLAAGIDVQTDQGKVALSGTVENAEEARRAVKGALAVEGVRGVVNDLDVAPEESAGAEASLAAAAPL
jgi:hypothetical protein